MDISKQCCTLEQAKKLKELGVKQESAFLFEYCGYYGKDVWNLKDRLQYDIDSKDIKSHWDRSKDCSAFTVAELGEMLKDIGNEKIYDFGWHSFFNSINQKWSVSWWYNREGYQPVIEFQESEAQARAQFLIHLLESKTITATEVNERK